MAFAPSRMAGSYHTVKLNPAKYALEFGQISREVLAQLIGSGADIEITIDIHATKTEGFTDAEIRIISENPNTLKFDPNSGFVES